jgi:endo-1,4-beta-xylanase
MKPVFLNILLTVMMLFSSVSTVAAASERNMIGSAAPQSQQAAGSIVVSSVNFDDSTTGTWTQSGSPTLGFVDDGNGGKALSILRTNDFDGIQSPTGLLEAGVQYTFSMRARLPADSAVTSTEVRFVVKPNFNWVANTTINATGWTTITGTYTLPDGVDPAAAQIYIGSTNQSSPYTILIDDIVISRPAATVTISSVNFDDSTTGTWTQSGSPMLGFVDDGNGGKALSILRTNDFDGIQSSTGLLEASVEYTFSMRARLPADSAVTSTEVRFVVKPNFNWVANTTINATSWMTVTGTYTLPDGVDPAAVQIYIGSTNQSSPYTILIDDILITGPDSGGGGGTEVINTDFESGLDGWVLRQADSTPATLVLTETESHSPTHAALVTDRDGQGDGIGRDVSGLMNPGTTYLITAWVKFAAGSPADMLWLSMRRTNGGADSYDTIGQFANTPGDEWREVTATYQMGAAESAFLYFETRWPDGTTAPFLVDDIVVQEQGSGNCDTSLTPIKETVTFPFGVAIDSRETTGAYSCLLQHHFNQITPENHMKPEAWYDASRDFRIHPEAKALMDYAQANNLRVYGHTLLWHQQTPAWFFQRADGTPLTDSAADQEILRTRLRDHIFNVARTLSEMYGPFGSSTNPLSAFDVVNEVISDSAEPDGLRRSSYYNILGPSYIEDAFRWAEQAFNVDYAASGATRPVALVINDYNTEQADKRQRLHNLVTDLLSRNVPVDIVGHQFHASLTTPVQGFDDALTAFEGLPVKQAVTELDVMTGTPVDEAKFIEQGYFYRDAFRIFRAHAASLYSVTVWGLYDSRSWRSDNAPLIFDSQLAAKPAYFGATDQTLPARLRTALVFQADMPLDAEAPSALEWQKLRLHDVGDTFSFQLRWQPDHLSVFVEAQDDTPQASDRLTFTVGDNSYTFGRDGAGEVPGVVEEVSGGWRAVVHLPLDGAEQNDQIQFDVALTDGGSTLGWNDPGATGTLTLVEPLSYLEVAGIGNGGAPGIDGEVDLVWELANTVSTGKQITGVDTATADVKTLWKGNTLYVLAHVHDDLLDDTASDPWQKDSVEIYVDAGNYKNGAYLPDDTQIRINYKNQTSFGTGDTAAQQARLVSATQVVDDGYIVEASISLLDESGVDTFHGLDFQVNDAVGGTRVGIRNWADPTNAGYLSTSHWGVGRLLEADQTVPVLHLSTPIDLTATANDGYHELTAAAAGVTATDAFDDPAWLTLTSDAPEVLPVGSNAVTWMVTDLSGNTATKQQTIVVHARMLTSLTYNGSRRAVITNAPSSFTAGAVLSAPSPACVAGQPVRFTLDRDPVTGNALATVLGTAMTEADGKVKLTVATNAWKVGTYTLTAIYDGNNLGCVGSSTSVTLTVVRAPPRTTGN